MFFFQMPYLPEFFLQHDCCSSLNAMFRDMDKKPLKNCTEEDLEAYKYTFSKKGLLNQYKYNYYRGSSDMLLYSARLK